MIHTLDIPGVGDVYVTSANELVKIIWVDPDDGTDYECTVPVYDILTGYEVDPAKVEAAMRAHQFGE